MAPLVVTDLAVQGPHGTVPVRSYRPLVAESARDVGLVWLHGGGFWEGDLDVREADWVSRCLAAAGIAVISVDYRLAVDGVHFPVPSDDVLAVWRWATSDERFGVQASSWHIGGGSAGGTLAASVAMQARDGRAVLPRSCVLVYPLLHDVLPPPSSALAARLAILPVEERSLTDAVRAMNLNYVGDPALLQHPYAFPANGEADALPPTLIVNSAIDPLRASGEYYGAQLAVGGVDVTVVCEPDVKHGHLNEPDSDGARRTVARMIAWLVGDVAGEAVVG